MSISLIKLKNGIEVIGHIVKIDNSILLEDPMQVNYKSLQNSELPVISFSRYCPLSVEDIFQFDKEYVLHVTPVKKSIEKYYMQAVQEYKMFIEKYMDEEFTNALQPKESIQRELYKKFLEKVKIDGYAQ
jgi:hypothetical protein